MDHQYRALTAIALSLGLTACGGGGGDSAPAPATTAPVSTTPPVTTTPAPTTPTPATTSAEGVYEGTVSNGQSHFSLVLENGDIYVMYGKTVNTVFGVAGFLRGSGKSANGAFTASDIREYAPGVSNSVYTFNGTYVADASLAGTVAGGGTSLTYTGAKLSNSTYTYATPAKLSDITGAWTLNDLAGAKVALNIGADGKFTGNSGGCAVTGTLAPRASGKNVFDFTLVFGAAPCALPGQTASGAALSFTIGAQRQLIAAGTDTSRQNGTAFIGVR